MGLYDDFKSTMNPTMTIEKLFNDIYAPALRAEVEQLKKEVEEVRKLRKHLEELMAFHTALKGFYANHHD